MRGAVRTTVRRRDGCGSSSAGTGATPKHEKGHAPAEHKNEVLTGDDAGGDSREYDARGRLVGATGSRQAGVDGPAGDLHAGEARNGPDLQTGVRSLPRPEMAAPS